MPEDLQYEYTLDDKIAKITSAYGSAQLPQNKTIAAADAANRIPTHNGANQVFDNEGQTTANGSQSYTWDARGRLTQATASGQTVGYGYDALGRRVSRTDASGTMTFQYDGADVVMDRQGAATTDYVNGMGIDEKLRMGTGSGASYFQQDHLGSVIGLTGVVNERYSYEAFGALTTGSSTRYGFTGRERDAATGLLYYRARWYDAGQGRFLTEDPIGFGGGDTNLYAYVMNNPMSHTDSTGQAIDTLVDVGFIGYDLYRIVNDNILGNCDNLAENLLALGLDVLGMLIPFVTGLGIASRVLRRGDDFIDFYHATSRAGSASIRKVGIDLAESRAKTDFGRGFYTTTDKAQALEWAAQKFGDSGEVLTFRVNASDLGNFKGLRFDGPTADYLDFVRGHRTGSPMHDFDFVEGPLLGNPGPFLLGAKAYTWGQQTSWHTQRAFGTLMKGLLP
ncbi:MAG: RHS repeat-associated core domain-containing protein [Blastocatellales bacterium]